MADGLVVYVVRLYKSTFKEIKGCVTRVLSSWFVSVLEFQGTASVTQSVNTHIKLCCSILILAGSEMFVYDVHFRIPLYMNLSRCKMVKEYVCLNLHIFTKCNIGIF